LIFLGIFLDGHRTNAVFAVVFAFRAEKSCPVSFKEGKETNKRWGCPSSLEQLQVALYSKPTFCPVFVPTVMENVKSSGLPPPFCPLSLTSLFQLFLAILSGQLKSHKPL